MTGNGTVNPARRLVALEFSWNSNHVSHNRVARQLHAEQNCRFLAYVLLSGAVPELKLVPPFFSDWVGGDPADSPGRSFFGYPALRLEIWNHALQEQKCPHRDSRRKQGAQKQTPGRNAF